jgi:hypothetical protein
MWIGTALVLRLEEPSSMTKTYALHYTMVAHYVGIVQVDRSLYAGGQSGVGPNQINVY